MQFLLERKNTTCRAPSSTIAIWRGGLSVLDINTPWNSLRRKWILNVYQRLLSPTNALWKGLMLYVLTGRNSEF